MHLVESRPTTCPRKCSSSRAKLLEPPLGLGRPINHCHESKSFRAGLLLAVRPAACYHGGACRGPHDPVKRHLLFWPRLSGSRSGVRPAAAAAGSPPAPTAAPGPVPSSSNNNDTNSSANSNGNTPEITEEEVDATASTELQAAAASVAAAAVAEAAAAAAVPLVAAAAAAAPPPPPTTSAMHLLRRVVGMLRAHLLPVLLVFAVKEAAAFLLHRVAQRITNHAAEVLLGTPVTTAGNPWWLYLDATFIRSNPGYELLVGLFFLLCLPFNLLLNSTAFTTVALLVAPPNRTREALAAAGVASGGGSTGGRAGAARGHGGRSSGAASDGGAEAAAALLADLGIQAQPAALAAAAKPGTSPASPLRYDLQTSWSTAAAAPMAPAVEAAVPPAQSATLSSIGLDPEPLPLAAATAAPVRPAATGEPAAGCSSGTSTSGGARTGGATELQSAAPAAAAAVGAGAGAAPAGVAQPPKEGPVVLLRRALGRVLRVLPDTLQLLRRVWWADIHFTVRALPLQGLSLLVFPAFWTVPRLMRLQATLPSAVLEGKQGVEALDRSRQLMAGSLAAYGIPFAALLGLGRLIEYVQGIALVLIPPRWWRDAVEVPLLIAGAFLLLKTIVHRLQDLLPLATYLELTEQERQNEAQKEKERQQLLSQGELAAS